MKTKVLMQFVALFPTTWFSTSWGIAVLALIWTINNPFDDLPLVD